MSADIERQNPFVGLRPFFDEDAFYFFGRREQTTDLLQLLHEHRFVPVLGSSGSGKSSLVRAGLIPMLRGGFMVSDRDGWRMAKCRPGEAPLENLAEALQYAMGEGRAPASAAVLAQRMREEHADAVIEYVRGLKATENLFILVDQFEELFAFRAAAGDGEDESGSAPTAEQTAERIRRRQDAATLVSLLLALTRPEQQSIPVYVSITMRTDFLGDCDLFEGLPEAINVSGYLVPRLTRRQLRECVAGPARLHGAQVAPRLVDRVLNEVGDRGDQLPVLQHALLRTWERWEAGGRVGPLDLVHFEQAGGLDGALAQQANEITADADPRMVERIFTRLTTTDARRRRVRSPARFSELVAVSGATPPAVKAMLDDCVKEGVNFLYAAPDGKATDLRYDLVHESLIRQWPTLRAWVDEESALRDWWQDIRRKAGAARPDFTDERVRPEEGDFPDQRDEDELLPPRAVQEADERRAHALINEAWAQRYDGPGATFDETLAYIERSREAIDRRRREAERARYWRRVGAAAAVVVLALATLGGAWAGRASIRSALLQDYLQQADSLSRDFTIGRLAETDPTYATALAAEFGPTQLANPDRLELVHRVLAAPAALAEYTDVMAMALDDRGMQVALGYADGTVALRAADGRGPETWRRDLWTADGARGHAQREASSITALAFAADKRSLLVVSDSTVRRVRLATATTDAQWWTGGDLLTDVRESPDGRYLAALSWRSTLHLWRQGPRQPSATVPNVQLAAFDATGRLYVATRRGEVRRMDLARRVVNVLAKATGEEPGFLVVTPRGDRVIVGGYLVPTRVIYGPGRLDTLSGLLPTAAALSPDGTRLAVGSIDGGVAVVDLTSLQTRWHVRDAHTQPVVHVAFADSGRVVVSTANDRTARWTASSDGKSSLRLMGHRDDPGDLRTAAFGARAALLDRESTVRVWASYDDATRFTPPAPLGKLRHVALSATGSVAVSAFADATVLAQFLGRARDTLTMTWSGRRPDSLFALSLSPTGDRALIIPAGMAGAYLWSVDRTAARPLAQDTPTLLNQGLFSADGSTLVLEQTDGMVVRADARTGASLGVVARCDSTVRALDVSPDGQMVALWCEGRDSLTLATPDTSWSHPIRLLEDVQVLRFRPDGKALFVGGTGPFALLLDGAGLQREQFIESPRYAIRSAAFSHDGTRLVTGTWDKHVQFFRLDAADADTAQISPDTVIQAHALEVSQVAFSPDDSLVVATAADGRVRVFRMDRSYRSMLLPLADALPYSTFPPIVTTAVTDAPRRVVSVALLAEPEAVGSASRTLATYRQWDIDPDRLLQRLRTRSSVCVPTARREQLLAVEGANARLAADKHAACEYLHRAPKR
ncbi:MAG: WD40 repeat domain-containing protein [Gemmatimonas sp.]|uniref:WD40 repeat domain-containing protein n=1 Tax=Gemmatimonas sp. TaxID=1962908 RepID=UPI00391F2E9F